MCRWTYTFILFIFIFTGSGPYTYAQTDTIQKPSMSSFLMRQRGILHQLAKQLLTDTLDDNQLLRNDELFQEYKGRVIRNIKIHPLDFGVSITDTTKRLKNKLIRLSNGVHRQTQVDVIRNNLFFSENEKLSPYRMADNEKHLRDLSFLQDAKIVVEPVDSAPDSVDITILTKDVLSLGGSLSIHSNQSAGITLKDDNFFGWGDHIQVQTFYDLDRTQKMGYGFAYTKRNIGGSFIDASAGYLNFERAFSSEQKEERVSYIRLDRPLVNRYTKWQYGLEAAVHSTKNLYNTDSVYNEYFRYRYHIVDTWVAWNMDADKMDSYSAPDRIRKLIGLRLFEQDFSSKPLRYLPQHYNRYTDIVAVLGDFSLFKQNFYKTHYIYGFGRNEDVPEGGGASLTAGYTKMNSRERLYAAINFQRYYFNASDHYFNYTLRTGTYLFKNRMEDINMLASVEYFSRLYQLSRNWKQRIFLSLSAAKQIKNVYNDLLILESDYGLPDFNNNSIGGRSRITLKSESVFYSPLSLLFFRFAPFAFANASMLNIKAPGINDHKIYSALGGGIRIRNESLIFKTIEFKGMYFPRKNFGGESWRVEFGTNIRFKYNQEFIKRPEFVRVN